MLLVTKVLGQFSLQLPVLTVSWSVVDTPNSPSTKSTRRHPMRDVATLSFQTAQAPSSMICPAGGTGGQCQLYVLLLLLVPFLLFDLLFVLFLFVVFFSFDLFLHRFHFVSPRFVSSHFSRCGISMFGIRSIFCEYDSGEGDCDECSDDGGQDLLHSWTPNDSI